MASVNKNKSNRGKRQSSRNGKGRNRTSTSAATRSAKPVIVATRDEIVPDNLSTTLLYADQFTITSGGGTYIQQQWKINSAYDPDYTNTGAQPVGYDQLAALYGFYKVYKAELEVVMTAPAAYTKWMTGCLYVSPNITIATTFGAQAAQPHGKMCFFSLYKEAKMRVTVDVAKFMGVDSAEFADVVYGADVGSNPTRLLYATLVLMNADNSVGSNCQISFKLKMQVQFQQRTYLGLSLMTPKVVQPPAKEALVAVTSEKPKRTFKSILQEFDLIEQ